jgi:hypothetical protein
MKKHASGTEGTFLRQLNGGFKIFSNGWFMFLLLVVVAAGCKKVIEETGLTGVCPEVVATTPVGTATGVNLTTAIDATFNEAMDASTITTETFTVAQGVNAVPGTVSYTGTTATFIPSINLSPNTMYTGTIIARVKDPEGNAMLSNYVWNFTTSAGPDVTAPRVTATDPINAAIGVAFSKVITAAFSEAMDSLTAATSFTLTNTTLGGAAVTGSVTYLNNTAVFEPAADLEPNTTYTGTITTGAKDLAGNGLASDYVWNFTTKAVTSPSILGSAADFGAFGGSAGITNQGLNTVINDGSIGTTGASTLVTGFHDGITAAVYTETPLNKGNIKGGIFTAPPAPGTETSFEIVTQALSDANDAYNAISPASKPGGIDPGAGELGGLTLPPGIYKSASGTFNITNGDLTLDAMGDPNAEWIFQTASGLTVGVAGPSGARSVNMINGGQPKNVYWYVGSAATINGAGGGVMSGTIIASAGITFSTAGNATQTVLNGRALSLNASVTMVNTTINVQ